MNRRLLDTLIAAALSAHSLAANADHIDPGAIPTAKRSALELYLTAEEAYRFKQARPGVLLVDVRSNAEVAFLGMATVADANIPYMRLSEAMEWDERRRTLKLESNPGFAEAMDRLLHSAGVDKNAPLVLICRSGKRSARAASLLARLGYSRVYSVVDGYEGDVAKEGPHRGQRLVNGWKNRGLPWSYSLDRDKVVRVGW